MGFRRVTGEQLDETRVTLVPLRSENGAIVGRVQTLAINEDGEVEMMSTEAADPPIAEALKLALQLADFKEQDVDVFDPKRLWRDEWGELK